MEKLIVGLGNPGKDYQNTRHNFGWIIIDFLLEKYGFDKKQETLKSELYFTKINGKKVILQKPLTYMNLSGEAVVSVMNFYKINKNDLLIIHDDKDLDFAKPRFKNNGSAGGQNGVKNIIQHLGTQDFNRLRVGIGKVDPNYKIIDWVMKDITQSQKEDLKKEFIKFCEGIDMFIEGQSFLKIMNKFNQKS
ncbi:peptidyl-tRNA hydrolase [Spiroplasma sp. TIUS-1]|uniref:aminoacyl-tRNA hydrolase n=1 Tax=Spiroplasma sp. TIUS-1 TaxID=216963 RepID=UPI0013996018|nr:aminoacyl-tRNA hydrolase [Spiroplasma sp. TIUS-1]QHX36236.1 peptidyl-tRNA hydrolase [Spiroplasma sp. TIUS-1]